MDEALMQRVREWLNNNLNMMTTLPDGQQARCEYPDYYINDMATFAAIIQAEAQRQIKEMQKWKHRAHLFQAAYQDKVTEVMALTIQKLDLESLGDEAMRIQRDRARESANKMISRATANLTERAEAAEKQMAEARSQRDRAVSKWDEVNTELAKAHAEIEQARAQGMREAAEIARNLYNEEGVEIASAIELAIETK